MIFVTKIFESYYTGSATLPNGTTVYKSPEILPAGLLAEEFRKRGFNETDIEAAFAVADKHWIPRPVRQG
jgi:hypothetical protein